MMGYVALVAAFILIAVALNGGLGQSVSRRIEYPELLTAIGVLIVYYWNGHMPAVANITLPKP